jgi:hypothetical protein
VRLAGRDYGCRLNPSTLAQRGSPHLFTSSGTLRKLHSAHFCCNHGSDNPPLGHNLTLPLRPPLRVQPKGGTTQSLGAYATGMFTLWATVISKR